jgi:hypothetical protein
MWDARRKLIGRRGGHADFRLIGALSIPQRHIGTRRRLQRSRELTSVPKAIFRIYLHGLTPVHLQSPNEPAEEIFATTLANLPARSSIQEGGLTVES